MKRFYIVEVAANDGNKHHEFTSMTKALKFVNEQVANGFVVQMFKSK